MQVKDLSEIHEQLTNMFPWPKTKSDWDQPRRAFVINAFADGVISDSDEALLESVPVVPKGNKMQGQFFPYYSIHPLYRYEENL